MKLFYDHLMLLEDINSEIEVLEVEVGHKQKLKKTIDDLVNFKVMTKILDLLPKIHHEEFLQEFHKSPANIKHLEFLQRKVEIDIKKELIKLGEEIKKEIKKEIGSV